MCIADLARNSTMMRFQIRCDILISVDVRKNMMGAAKVE